jgi:hypothetical protein
MYLTGITRAWLFKEETALNLSLDIEQQIALEDSQNRYFY